MQHRPSTWTNQIIQDVWLDRNVFRPAVVALARKSGQALPRRPQNARHYEHIAPCLHAIIISIMHVPIVWTVDTLERIIRFRAIREVDKSLAVRARYVRVSPPQSASRLLPT